MQTLAYLRKNMVLVLNQILRRLMQQKMWRFVCFASSVVGLLCYALSSSLNHLLGKWTWWKILLYIVFSFFICVTFLFTTARQHSTSLRLETHLAFLVLMVTSIYSFFFDKAVNGKPDAYTLISYASFAIMSLGLSRLTQFGFEIDLLHFFCGGLIIQLMKINLWLGIIGGSFSYFLIILRSSLVTPEEHLRFQVQNQVIIQIDPDSEDVNADGDSTLNTPPENGDEHVVTQNHSYSQGNVDDGPTRLQFMDCIKALEKENEMLVPMVCSHVDKYLKAMVDYESKDEDQLPDPDVNFVMDTLPSGIITRLRETVKLMIVAGFEQECCDVYSNWRREFLKQCLAALGLQLQALDTDNFEKWIKTCTAAGKILFPNERRLCDSVFSGFTFATEVSFTKVCQELTIRLLSFADNIITTGSYLPNLVFSIIPKMSDSLHELNREFNSKIFYADSVALVADVGEVQNRLGILMELANLVYRNMAQATVDGRGLHPISLQVMNYISNIRADSDLKALFIQYYCRVPGREGKSSFSVLIAEMIELLETNLEAKSRDYTDPALAYVFMMNNLRYIGQEAYKLKSIVDFTKLDDDWFRQNTAKVEQNCRLYQRSSWNKMLDFLKLEKNESVAPNVVAESMKGKLNLFNLHFEEICNVQSTWIVSDEQLRKQIIKSIENILLPAYGKFIDRFLDVFGKHAYEYIKYGIVDIQNFLSHLLLVSE